MNEEYIAVTCGGLEACLPVLFTIWSCLENEFIRPLLLFFQIHLSSVPMPI